MIFEEIQEIIAKVEHLSLELKKATGGLQDGMFTADVFLDTNGGRK